jgi:hypothetical protein
VSGGCRCIVWEGTQSVVIGGVERALVLGFVIVRRSQEVLWCYVRSSNRGNGLMVALLDAAGVDTTRTMRMATRTPASDAICEDLIARGWQITLKEPDEREVH